MKTKSWGKIENLKITRVSHWKTGQGAFVYCGKKRYVWTVNSGTFCPEAGQEIKVETRYSWAFRSWAIVSGA